MASETTKIILTRSEDWEKWIWQLQGSVNEQVWPYINPDEAEQALLVAPVRPRPQDFEQNTATYALLSAANQKLFENARRFYEEDKKDYNRQRDLLQEARNLILSTVSQSKKTHLDPKLSVRQWIKALKDDTEPPKGHMLTYVEKRYRNTLKSHKQKKLSQWLDEWEATMIECIKYDLPEVQNGRWLRDLADLVRPASEVFYMQFMNDADSDEKSDPKEFRRVARQLRQRLEPLKGGRTQRGGAFNADFKPTETEEASDATPETKATPKGKGRKRSGTQSGTGAPDPKKTSLECPACGRKGHSLPECWCIFEDLIPEGMTVSAYRIRKAKKTVADDEQLKKQMEELRQKMEKTKIEE